LVVKRVPSEGDLDSKLKKWGGYDSGNRGGITWESRGVIFKRRWSFKQNGEARWVGNGLWRGGGKDECEKKEKRVGRGGLWGRPSY